MANRISFNKVANMAQTKTSKTLLKFERLEYEDSITNSFKFYAGYLFDSGNTYEVVFVYGRIGTSGKVLDPELFKDKWQAERRFNEQLGAKASKGYVYVAALPNPAIGQFVKKTTTPKVSPKVLPKVDNVIIFSVAGILVDFFGKDTKKTITLDFIFQETNKLFLCTKEEVDNAVEVISADTDGKYNIDDSYQESYSLAKKVTGRL